MPISEVVKQWCKKRNRDNNTLQISLAALVGTAVLVGVAVSAKSPMTAFLAAGFVLTWLFFSPKPLYYSRLRTTRNLFVPDDLLALLADAQAVPEWVKTAIANDLERNRRITFEVLFDIEGWIGSEAAYARVEQQHGFQKMVAFSQKNIGR